MSKLAGLNHPQCACRCLFLAACVLLLIFTAAAAAAAPALTASFQSGRIELSWNRSADEYVLEVSDRFAADAEWWPARRASKVEAERQTVSVTPGTGGRFYRLASRRYVSWIQTTQGPLSTEGGGVILPHEHIFTDLRGPTTPGYATADADDVVRVMKPRLVEAKEAGVQVLVECSSIGVGRNPEVIQRLAEESGLPVVVPTGVYGRANFAPPQHRTMTEDELAQLFTREIEENIPGTTVKAGFIKIATSESALTSLEERILRAAGRAAVATGAVVASHTTSGRVARRQVDILESISPEIRFIWVHAQAERNRAFHRELAARGVFIELDSLGWQPAEDNNLITAIKELLEAGYGDRILLSHDAGWYQPGQRNGGTQKPYTYLHKTFIPKLRSSGVPDAAIRMVTEENPVRAFAFQKPAKDAPPSLSQNP